MSVLELALPSTRDEAWRWSDMDTLKAARGAEQHDAPLPDPILADGLRLVFVDGCVTDHLGKGDLELTPATLTSDHPLSRYAAEQGHAISLPAASVTTLEIARLNTGTDSHMPLTITLAEDAVLTLIETYTGTGWSNALTRFDLGKGARLMRAVRLIQDEGFVSIRDEASIGEAASYVSTFLGTGRGGSRIDGLLRLDGVGAFAEMGGALLTRDDQRQECAVAIHHAAPEGTSRQIWRAVAADASTVSLAARAQVARHAQKTDGEQSLRGLLLKRTATINLKPELEIFADDVKCAHGATVGELDATALFYMQSRGIAEPQARALLTHAFVADALDRIGDEAVREAFKADAATWLEAAL